MERDARLIGGAAVGAQALVIVIFLAVVGCGGGGGGGGGGDSENDLPEGVGRSCLTDGVCDAGLVCQACVEECTGRVRRCAGFADSSELISLQDGIYPGGCESIAGPWSITETVDGGCEGEEGGFISLDGSGTDMVDIRQNACAISYQMSSDLGNFSRSGTIVGSRARVTGPFVATGRGLKLDTNEIVLEGGVAGDRLTLRGLGVAEGTLDGFPATCEVMSTVNGTRQ
jgi:hypothetical protein